MNPLLKRSKTRFVQPAATNLIGIGGVGETVGNHPFTSGECRFDQRGQMLATGREHQHGLGFKVHWFVKQQFAQFFAKGRAARLAGLHDLDAFGLDQGHGGSDLAALAGAVYAFEGDEAGFHGLRFRMYWATARLCSSRVRENSLEPSPRATK